MPRQNGMQKKMPLQHESPTEDQNPGSDLFATYLAPHTNLPAHRLKDASKHADAALKCWNGIAVRDIFFTVHFPKSHHQVNAKPSWFCVAEKVMTENEITPFLE